MKKRICNINNNLCPCRFIDNDNKQYYCNFIDWFVALSTQNKVTEASHIMNKICNEIRQHIHSHDIFVERLRKQKIFFLERIKYGEECFCTLEEENVIFLEKPTSLYGDVKYRTADGKVAMAPGFYFFLISKGKKESEYCTKDKDKAEKYSLMAKMNGFRVENEKLGDIHILRIYGDNQEILDEFVANLNSGLVLDNHYVELDFFYDT